MAKRTETAILLSLLNPTCRVIFTDFLTHKMHAQSMSYEIERP